MFNSFLILFTNTISCSKFELYDRLLSLNLLYKYI